MRVVVGKLYVNRSGVGKGLEEQHQSDWIRAVMKIVGKSWMCVGLRGEREWGKEVTWAEATRNGGIPGAN